jgi:N-acetylmuramoyl-L-alanine amidase
MGLIAALLLAVNWSSLDRYQHTISRAEFDSLLTNVYDIAGTLQPAYSSNSVTLAGYTLRFTPNAPTLHVPRITRVVLDPGHIGGAWARVEERWFQRGKDRPVQEAALNLTVARILKRQLEAAGITVLMTKDNFEPVTNKRPEDFRAQAELDGVAAVPGGLFDQANRADAVRKRQEIRFYRSAEIEARARLVNDQLKPDLTLCIHFNAVEWNQCFDLVEDNRVIIFTHGDYLPAELAGDDQKFRLLQKLLERSHAVEQTVAGAVAAAFGKATGLPVEVRPRNLAANRLFDGPVVYLEPYYMNNRIVYQRIQLGDYDGEKAVEGKSYRSIFREYADAVMEGLRPHLAPRN